MMHGHQYNVNLVWKDFLCSSGGAGRYSPFVTHSPYNKEVRGIKILNPGSIGRGLKPSYGLIIIKTVS